MFAPQSLSNYLSVTDRSRFEEEEEGGDLLPATTCIVLVDDLSNLGGYSNSQHAAEVNPGPIVGTESPSHNI